MGSRASKGECGIRVVYGALGVRGASGWYMGH